MRTAIIQKILIILTEFSVSGLRLFEEIWEQGSGGKEEGNVRQQMPGDGFERAHGQKATSNHSDLMHMTFINVVHLVQNGDKVNICSK